MSKVTAWQYFSDILVFLGLLMDAYFSNEKWIRSNWHLTFSSTKSLKNSVFQQRKQLSSSEKCSLRVFMFVKTWSISMQVDSVTGNYKNNFIFGRLPSLIPSTWWKQKAEHLDYYVSWSPFPMKTRHPWENIFEKNIIKHRKFRHNYEVGLYIAHDLDNTASYIFTDLLVTMVVS